MSHPASNRGNKNTNVKRLSKSRQVKPSQNAGGLELLEDRLVMSTVQASDAALQLRSAISSLDVGVMHPQIAQAPHFDSSASASFHTGTAGSFTVQTSQGAVAALSESGSLPSGVSFHDNGDGTATISGTPATGSGASYALTLTANNGQTTTQNFTLSVNEAPSFSSSNSATFVNGTAHTFTINTNGFPNPAITQTGTLPSGLTFHDNGDGTATISGSASTATGGTYHLTLGASSSQGTASQSLTLVVNHAPAITSASSQTFDVGAAGTFVIHTTGTPTASISKTGSLPSGLSFVDNGNGTATISGTPSGSTGGSYALTITANNGVGANATQNFTLQVLQTPVITSGASHLFTVGQAGSFTVTTTGYPTADMTETGSLPAGLSFNDNGDGTATISGTPSVGTQGTSSISVIATNVLDNASQTFTINVGVAPAFTSAASTTFTAGSASTFTISTAGFPIDAITKVSGSLPSGVSFLDNGDGTATLSGTPDASAGGTYTLHLSASNTSSPTATQTFTLTVAQAPAITSGNHISFVTGINENFTVHTTGYGTSAISETGALPSGVTFVDNGDGTASLSGNATVGGVYNLTIDAGNGVGSDDTQSFTLTVYQHPSITSANHTTMIAGTPSSFTVATQAYPNASLSESGSLPSGVSFNDNGDGTATISGTPGATTGGTYSFTITGSNGIGASASQVFTITVDQAPSITSVNNKTFVVGTSGSFTVSTTEYPVATINESGSLPAGISLVDNGNGTATLSGTPNAGTAGIYNITMRAANGIGANAAQAFTITVQQVPAITSASTESFSVGNSGLFIFHTTGYPSAALSETGALPTGVTFHNSGNGTATLSGTPQAGAGGVYTLTITASNATGVDATQTFTLTVAEAADITSASSTSMTVGSAGTFTVTTNGFAAPTLVESGSLPSGVTFVDNGDGTGTLAGTPASGTQANYSFTITANNGVGTDVQSFSLQVGQPPAITSANNHTFTTGASGSFTVSTTGFPSAALTESGALPSGLTFVDNNNGTATISGTPANSTGASYAITITAANGYGTNATQSFTLVVDQHAVITSSASTTMTVGTAGSFGITSTGYPTAALSESGTLPTGVTFVDNHDGTATLSGTPAAAQGGVYNITITGHNGIGSDSVQNFALTINQAPAITSSASHTYLVGASGSFTVTTTGFPTAAITTSTTLPTGLTLVDNGNGTATISGTPAAGQGGVYTIALTSSNGVGTAATQNFTLRVNEAASITSAASSTFTVGGSNSLTITTLGYPAASLTKSGSLPSGVTFHDNGDGTATLSGNPASGSGGVYNLIFTAANSSGANATQNFTLTVNQASAITSVNHATYTVGSNGSITITTIGYPTAVISESGSLPTGVTLVDNLNGTATLSGTAAAGTGGDYPITISASNGIGSATTQSFDLVIREAASITSSSTATFRTGVSSSFTISTLGFPIDTLSTASSLPSGLTFTDNHDGTATISGTPGAASGGNYTINLVASNGVAANATQALALTVNQAPAFTSAVTNAYTIGASGSFTVTTTGFPIATLSESGTLPSGLSLVDNHDGTATLSGTPAAGTAGNYSIILQATNGVGATVTQGFTLKVYQVLAITSPNTEAFQAGSPNTFQFHTTGSPTAALSEVGALPTGVSFHDLGNGIATLQGTPAAGTGGVYDLTITASNGVEANATQNFEFTVNELPTFISNSSVVFIKGQASTFTVQTYGFPAPTLGEIGSMPAGLSFVDNGNGTATISGTPTVNATSFISLTGHNIVGDANAQTFQIEVATPPSITSSTSTHFVVGTSASFQVTSTGYPDAMYSETGALPTGITFDTATGIFSGTPSAGSAGIYNLTIGATNSVSPDASQSFTLEVDQVPAITSTASTSMLVGNGASFTISTTGFPTTAISETGALPTGVTLVDNGDGTATLGGTPASGSQGTYSVNLDAGNGVGNDATQTFTLVVALPPSFTSSNSTTFVAGTAGGFTISTSGYPIAAINESGALPSGVSFVDNGDGTATLSGTPSAGTGGTYALSLAANNTYGTDAAQNFTLTVNEAPSITSSSSLTMVAGTSASFTVQTSGFPTAALSENGSLPNGVTFVDNGDGTATLSGTPTVGSDGVFTLSLSATNTVNTATQNFVLTVNQAPAITSASSTTFTAMSLGNFTVNTSGFPTGTITETGALPSGVTFIDNHGTASLTGTPAADAGGVYNFTINYDNGVGTAATQSFTLTVNQAAAITSPNALTFIAGTAGSSTITTTGFPAAAITTSDTLPTGLTLVDNGDGTASLSGTPASGTGGVYTINLSASNSVNTATQAITLTVDQYPVITSTNFATFATGSANSFTVTSSGFPTGALSESGALPTGVTFLDNGDGTATLAGTPAANAGGVYHLMFTSDEGIGNPSTQTFTLTVNQATAITSASTATFTTGTNGAFSIATTGYPAAAITETGALPTGVTLLDNGDGTASISGTPASGTGGLYAFTITADNQLGSPVTQSFTLTVNQASAITSANNATFVAGTAGSFTVTTTGYPVSSLTELTTLPTGLSFVDNGDGTATLSGTPAAGTGGTYSLHLHATNLVGAISTQTFTLTIDQAPAITSANHATFTTGTGGNFAVIATGFPAGVINRIGSLPTGVSLVDNHNGTATLSGTPAAGTGGAYAFTIRVTNGIGATASQSFTLTVDQATAITSVNHATFVAGAAGTFTVSTTAFPVSTLSEVGTLPGGLTFVDNHNGTATISGTPAAGSGGTYTLSLDASNGLASSALQSFTLTVNQASAITSAATGTFTLGTLGNVNIATTGFPTGQISETGTLPAGLNFVDNHDGTASIFGTPAAGTAGAYTLTIGATNGTGTAASQTFTLNVDQASAITGAASTTFTNGVAGSFTITTTGFPNAVISKFGTLPQGMTFVANSDGTATISGTPTVGSGGAYTLVLNASNGVGTAVTQRLTINVQQDMAFTSAAGATFATGSLGSFTIATTGFPIGSITETGTLRGGINFVDNGDGTATLSGVPSAGSGGAYTITLSADNGGITQSASQSFTLDVNQPAAVTSASTATFTAGNSSTFTFTTAGFPIAALTEAGALPSGIVFSDNGNGTATLSGTPALGTSGSYVLVLTGTPSSGSAATQNFTLVVNQAEVITSTATASFTAGIAGSFTVATTGSPVGALTETGALPTGLTFTDNGDGTATIAGTPADVSGGSYTLNLSASNGAGTAASQTLTLNVAAPQGVVIGSQTGNLVTTYPDGTVKLLFNPFPSGGAHGARVAQADFNHDGVNDIVVAGGAGGNSRVKVYDGKTGALLQSFLAFPKTYQGGLYVATGDVNNDGTPDIIVAKSDASSSRVRVYDGTNDAMIANFLAFDTGVAGGLHVASADFNHDGFADIVVAQGAGGTSQIKIFSGKDAIGGVTTVMQSLQPFGPSFTGGTYVATGDVNHDGTPDLIVGQGGGGTSLVKVLDGTTFNTIQSFNPYAAGVTSGVRVASTDANGDGIADIVVADNVSGTPVQIFSGADDTLLFTFTPATGTGGLFVG